MSVATGRRVTGRAGPDLLASYETERRPQFPGKRAVTPRLITCVSGVLKGLAGSPGTASGPVFRVFGSEDFGKFPQGAVLVLFTKQILKDVASGNF